MAEQLPWPNPEGSKPSIRDHIRFIFRGKPVELAGFPPTRSVLDWLREDQRAVGTKEGCNEGDCGACTAVIARVEGGKLVHKPINTCITFLGMLDGCELITIEDLAEGGRLHPIQQAMVEHHGSQCGFCTPGIVMSLFAMSKDEGPVTRERVNDQLAGNLCRCTGYRPIMDAALASVGKAADRFDARMQERIAALEALEDGSRAFVAGPIPSLRGGEADEANQTTSPPAEASTGLLRRSAPRNDGGAVGFFAAPRRLKDVLALFAEHPDATILAGATDVGLWITKQFRPVRKLVWLGHVAELQRIADGTDALRIGAGVSHDEALPYLSAISPDLAELGRRFGSKQVRAQGTVGGNIANGSPIGDWAPAFIALGAEVELASWPDERRSLPLGSFFIAYGKQDRRPCEIVASLTIPKPGPNERFRCFKISKRFDEDISALMGAFKLTVEQGKVTAARVAFGGMAATPKRAPQTEAALVGVSLAGRDTWEPALSALAADYQPISDMRASAQYRMEVARALLQRALIEIGGGTDTRLHAPATVAAE